jgi:hypothetical protein
MEESSQFRRENLKEAWGKLMRVRQSTCIFETLTYVYMAKTTKSVLPSINVALRGDVLLDGNVNERAACMGKTTTLMMISTGVLKDPST